MKLLSTINWDKVIYLTPFMIFFFLFAYIGLNAGHFFSTYMIGLILNHSVPVVIVCLGLSTVVMAGGDDVVSGGIDLSIPATAILGASIIAQLLSASDMNFALIVLLSFVATLLIGYINGFLVTRVGVTPLLATLSMFVAVVGFSKYVTSSRRITLDDDFIVFLRDEEILGLPSAVVITFVLALIFYHMVHRTKFGMHLSAAGGNRRAADISGIHVQKMQMLSFVIAGFTGFIASFFVLARSSGISPGLQDNLMLEMVLATFLGAFLSPRRIVTLWGAAVGAILVSALSIGFKMMAVNVFWTDLIKGCLIMCVMALSALSAKREAM